MISRSVAYATYRDEWQARDRARYLSKRYGLRFAVWRGSDGSYAVTLANRRPPALTWARLG